VDGAFVIRASSMEALTAARTRTPADAQELEAMQRRAWHDYGVIVLRPEEIADDFTRQTVINLGNQKFGKRIPK